MNGDQVTHFAVEDGTPFRGIEQVADTTLCGLLWTAIIMNDRPATCRACTDLHAKHGWTFPLPPTVV